jgi:hypothetical protein
MKFIIKFLTIAMSTSLVATVAGSPVTYPVDSSSIAVATNQDLCTSSSTDNIDKALGKACSSNKPASGKLNKILKSELTVPISHRTQHA